MPDTDAKQPGFYSVMHSHPHGESVYVGLFEDRPNLPDAIAKFDIDYEPDEYIDIAPVILPSPYDAAPELLDIGQRLLTWASYMGGFESAIWDELRTAVANAKGE